MSETGFSNLQISPLAPEDLAGVEELFLGYPYKDFQLRQLGIVKKNMVAFLKTTLEGPEVSSICLKEEGRVVGLISAKHLPWLSKTFGARMYTLQHLLTADRPAGYYQTMLHYLLEMMPQIDFLDCRVAGGDIAAIQALENSGFRFVGNEVYLARNLRGQEVPAEWAQTGCEPCPQRMRDQVMELVRQTHFHNRFMYDPEVPAQQAAQIYQRYLSGVAFDSDFRSQVRLEGDKVKGFILYKFNTGLSQIVHGRYASLDFIGVATGDQNGGVGESLNQAAIWDLKQSGVTHVVVRTFGTNYPALRIVHKIGCKITSSDLHFHFWQRPQAKAEGHLPSTGRPFVASSAVG